MVDETRPPVPIGSVVVDPTWPPVPEVVVLGTAPPVPTASAGASTLVVIPPEPGPTEIDASLGGAAESLRFELLPHPVATKAAIHQVPNTETKLQSFIATPATRVGAYEPNEDN